MKSRNLAALLLPAILLVAMRASAHSPICSCFENEDGTITCEGGFTDGASAEGVALRVYDQAGKVLLEGKMDKHSAFTFSRPKVPFRVEFDAGEGHVVRIDGRDIEE